MKEIVHVGSAGYISSIDHHGVPELLGVGLVVNTQLVQVDPGLHCQLVHDPVEFIIVDDGSAAEELCR